MWIEQEQQAICEGDVLIALSAIQDGEEFSASRDWWAVITKSDENQSIPRRADVPLLAPSPTRELRPLPEPATKSTTPPPPQAQTTNSPVPTPSRAAAPPPAQTDEDKIRAFLIGHHQKLTNRDLEGVVGTYGAVVQINGHEMTREQIREHQAEAFASRSAYHRKSWQEYRSQARPITTGSSPLMEWSSRRTFQTPTMSAAKPT